METYTVQNPDVVKSELGLAYAPVGLQVEDYTAEAASVNCVPPGEHDPIVVSRELLASFLESGVIVLDED